MENRSDANQIIVIGAGVAGSHAALEASKTGSKVLLLEEHPQVGVPSHCSGVVSLNGLSMLGIEPHSSFSQRMIQGAVFHPPKGGPLQIRTKKPVALIINRAKFDQYVAKNAVAGGVELHTKTRVSKFERYSDGKVGVNVQEGPSFKADIVIDASGAGSRLPEQAGLQTPDWTQLLPGLQYELADTQKQGDMVELFFGSHRAPGFFAWSIPTSDHNARVGLASRKGNVKKLLDDLVQENWPKSTLEGTKSGSVLVSGPIDKCWSENFLVVGDAASQVKQTTGGGIVIGGYSGILAGRAAAFAAKKPQEERWRILMQYDRDWREKFGSDLRRMGIAHKLFASLSDETLNKLFEGVREYLPEIEEAADMDFQGEIISRMLRKKKFVALLPRVAVDSIRAIFT
ncbi:MAG TPA: NAD(P)/FAD-dependent oxidoreductase [Candidatus Dormibacteraeota bacterium]|nr:NAD(P)/FAD-dependent oxidoreductase [Candidatus Dormibacteraeota bacterium]